MDRDDRLQPGRRVVEEHDLLVFGFQLVEDRHPAIYTARIGGPTSGPSGAEPIMRAVIPCAYLRVFRPLETFPPEERAQWERFILEGGAPASRQIGRASCRERV